MSDRYGPSSSSRHNRTRASRYDSSPDDGRPATYSEQDSDSDLPASASSSRIRSSPQPTHAPRSQSRASQRSHSYRHHQSRRHSRHHRHKKLLAPAEDRGKPRDNTAVAIRQDYQVQPVPRAHQPDVSDEEEVYDHRPRPLSHRGRRSSRSRSHVGSSAPRQDGRNNDGAGKGFLMAAAALAVSLVICCGGEDD